MASGPERTVFSIPGLVDHITSFADVTSEANLGATRHRISPNPHEREKALLASYLLCRYYHHPRARLTTTLQEFEPEADRDFVQLATYGRVIPGFIDLQKMDTLPKLRGLVSDIQKKKKLKFAPMPVLRYGLDIWGTMDRVTRDLFFGIAQLEFEMLVISRNQSDIVDTGSALDVANAERFPFRTDLAIRHLCLHNLTLRLGKKQGFNVQDNLVRELHLVQMKLELQGLNEFRLTKCQRLRRFVFTAQRPTANHKRSEWLTILSSGADGKSLALDIDTFQHVAVTQCAVKQLTFTLRLDDALHGSFSTLNVSYCPWLETVALILPADRKEDIAGPATGCFKLECVRSSKLTGFTLPANLSCEKVELVFDCLASLGSLALPAGWHIDDDLTVKVSECKSFKAFVLPARLTPKRLELKFSYVPALTSFSLRSEVESKGETLNLRFYECKALSEVVLPPDLKCERVRLSVVRCNLLRKFELPAGCCIRKSLDLEFASCDIREVVLPPDLKCERVRLTLDGCHNLQTLVLPPSHNDSAGAASLLRVRRMQLPARSVPSGWTLELERPTLSIGRERAGEW